MQGQVADLCHVVMRYWGPTKATIAYKQTEKASPIKALFKMNRKREPQ